MKQYKTKISKINWSGYRIGQNTYRVKPHYATDFETFASILLKFLKSFPEYLFKIDLSGFKLVDSTVQKFLNDILFLKPNFEIFENLLEIDLSHNTLSDLKTLETSIKVIQSFDYGCLFVILNNQFKKEDYIYCSALIFENFIPNWFIEEKEEEFNGIFETLFEEEEMKYFILSCWDDHKGGITKVHFEKLLKKSNLKNLDGFASAFSLANKYSTIEAETIIFNPIKAAIFSLIALQFEALDSQNIRFLTEKLKAISEKNYLCISKEIIETFRK